jgi:hypothetical protein
MLKNEIKNKTFTLRMNAEIMDKVVEAAFRNKRSTAKQIEFILEEYLKK